MNIEELPFVSVIMPVRNEGQYIKLAIESILENDYPANKMEILVVDGMSDDDTRNIVIDLASSDARIRLLDNEKGIVPFAMNIGLRNMKGELFTRVDGHAEIAPDFLKNSVRCLLDNKDAWLVGGYIENIAQGYIANTIAGAMQSRVGVGNATFRRGDYEGWVDTLAFGTHHKWILEKVGYFDEQLVRNQDDEFNARIIYGGGKIWLSKDIKSKYYTRSSLKKLWSQYYQYGFWRIRTMQKHRKPATIRQLVPLLFVSSLLCLFIMTLLWKPFALLLIAECALYSLGLMAGAYEVCRNTGLKYAILSPVVFAILHFGYGIGCLWGIVRFILFRGSGLPKPEDYKLSR